MIISVTIPIVSPSPIKALRIVRFHAYLGYAFGFHQPAMSYSLRIPDIQAERLLIVDRLLGQELGARFDTDDQTSALIPARLMFWTRVILEKAAHPVFEPAKLLPRKDGQADLHTIVQPCLNHSAAKLVVNFLINAINSALNENNRPTATVATEIVSGLSEALQGLAPTALQGFNQLHFLTAAFELGVPWTPLGKKLFQLGFGAKARWLESSFTDLTPTISTEMARNKVLAASMLRTSGLPVASHALARNDNEAVLIAGKLGYPVVVKPANLDGGKGVKANLRTPEAVRKAFAVARELTPLVLVEKHAPGRDYRVHVVNGKVHGVLDRIPGGVTGNGRDTVRALLERQNHERAVAVDDRRYLHQMAIDEEANDQLQAQDLDWDSIPPAGRFVRLRGASNVASGGVPVPVSLDEVHPDNLLLAIRAARVLRLDVAGIDLLIPDIRQSWLDSGAHICEVNAQPQMFTTMHKPMLRSLLNGGDGRIPVAIVLAGKSPAGNIGALLHRALLAKDVNAGLVEDGSAWVGKDCVNRNFHGAFAGTMMLRHDPAVEAMVICIEDDEIMNMGWPVDRCDVLIVNAGGSNAVSTWSRHALADWLAFAEWLSPKLLIVDAEAAATTSSHPDQREVPILLMEDSKKLPELIEQTVARMLSASEPDPEMQRC